jgi:hypothetical protein
MIAKIRKLHTQIKEKSNRGTEAWAPKERMGRVETKKTGKLVGMRTDEEESNAW